MSKIIQYLCCISLLVLAGTTLAKDNDKKKNKDSMDEIIVIGKTTTFGAGKSETPILETPRSISVITSKVFLDRGALSLSNALTYTAGVTSNAFGIATRGDFTSIRGLDAPQYQDNFQVLFGFYNNARVDIYTLEQVEILKGPASVLYGQAAPGGIVSTVSKMAGRDNLDKEVVFTAGTDRRYQVSLDTGFSLSKNQNWTTRIVAVGRDSDAQVDFVTDDAFVIAPSITYENETTKITALFNYTDRKSDTSAQFLPLAGTACANSDITITGSAVCARAPGREVNSRLYVGDPQFNRYDTESTTISLFAKHQFSDFLSFEGTTRYRDNEADYNQTWISFLGDGNARLLPNGNAAARTWYSAPASSEQFALDARLRANFNTGPLEHEVLLGVNYQDVETDINSALLYGRPTTFNVFDPVYDGSEIPTAAEFNAVRRLSENETKAIDYYLTDYMNIGNLVVSAGIRFSSVDSEDATNNQDDRENPVTIGLLYKTEIGLNPYFSYAESFRATVGTDVRTQSPLKPRKGEQTEVGIKYQPPGSASYITLAYFDLEEDNLIEFVSGGRTQPGLRIDTQGFEVEARLVWNDFTFDFDYRNLDADNVDEDGVRVTRPSLADDTASLWATWIPSSDLLNGFRFGAGVRYVGENESNGARQRIVTDSETIFDALIGYKTNKLDFTLNFRNLSDEDFYATCLSRGDCFPAERRTIVGSVKMQF